MKRHYLIDHRWLFLFGFIFYLYIPYLAGISHAFTGYPGIALYRDYFDKIPAAQMRAYHLITLSWLIAFFLGHSCFNLLRPPKKPLQLFPRDSTDYGLPAVGLLLFFLMFVFIFLARNSLFGGYASYDVGARGKMSTLLVIFNFFLLYQLIAKTKRSFFIVAGTIITSLLLLSMGGRMYVFQTLVILLVYKTSFAPKRWSSLKIFGFAIFGFFLASFSGILRLGASYNIERGLYSFFAEPVFTWISTSTFLASNQIPWINVPLNFLTSFLNLVPNTIVSTQPYLVSGQGMGFHYLSPLGADSVWTTYVINFGIIGSFFFIFLTGFLLNFLRYNSQRNRFAAVYYILVCGIMPFQFFRDGFYIVNKQLFFNFLFFPAIILFMIKLALYFNRVIKPVHSNQKTGDVNYMAP